MIEPTTTKPDCIILAGGEGKRMDGEDKGLVLYKNQPLIELVIEKIKPQVNNIVISANRNIRRYEKFGYPVISDLALTNKNTNDTYQGPLAGIAAALPACSNEWIFIIACDMPLVSDSIVSRLTNELSGDSAMETKSIAIAETNGKFQLAILLNKNLLPSIKLSLKNNQLKLMQWVKSNPNEIVKFSSASEFKNFNYFNDLL
jgi:molybdenum cofactor guanylyltransferase